MDDPEMDLWTCTLGCFLFICIDRREVFWSLKSKTQGTMKFLSGYLIDYEKGSLLPPRQGQRTSTQPEALVELSVLRRHHSDTL